MSKADDAMSPEEAAKVNDVRELMARVYRRAGYDLSGVRRSDETPLSALIAKEEEQPEDHYCAGQEMLRRFLEWIFQQGPNPAFVMQRVYTVTNALAPELLLNMSGAEVAAIFGQGRAAESARVLLLDKKMKAAGFKHTAFAPKKKEMARLRMARSARGNKNRRKSVAA